jgi:putative transposase
MNVENFAVSSLSTQTLYDNESKSRRNIRFSTQFKKLERKQSRRSLVSTQRGVKICQEKTVDLSKPQKNKRKTQLKMNKIHQKLKNKQIDLYHKLSRDVVNNFEMIAIEDLKLKNMTKSSKGNSVVPGKKVRQKSGLNRSILSASFSEFARMLKYKQTIFNDRLLTLVNPAYTSQTCSKCAENGVVFVDKGNRTSQSDFKCLQCGYSANADINASKNILYHGLAHHNYQIVNFTKLLGTGNVPALQKQSLSLCSVRDS